MKILRLLTLTLLFSAVLVTAQTEATVVDGSNNPSAITDQTALRLWFGMFGEVQVTSNAAANQLVYSPTSRQTALLVKHLQLSPADANVLLAAAYSWRQGFSQLPPTADLDAFTLPYNAKLASTMSSAGWSGFYKHLVAEKAGMKVYTYPPMNHGR